MKLNSVFDPQLDTFAYFSYTLLHFFLFSIWVSNLLLRPSRLTTLGHFLGLKWEFQCRHRWMLYAAIHCIKASTRGVVLSGNIIIGTYNIHLWRHWNSQLYLILFFIWVSNLLLRPSRLTTLGHFLGLKWEFQCKGLSKVYEKYAKVSSCGSKTLFNLKVTCSDRP
jgi:hypothetical protein